MPEYEFSEYGESLPLDHFAEQENLKRCKCGRTNNRLVQAKIGYDQWICPLGEGMPTVAF